MTAKTDPNICETCAQISPTCCRSSGRELDFRFPLSDPEVERIVLFLKSENLQNNSNFSDFYDMVSNTREFTNALAALFPGEASKIKALYKVGEQRKVLKVLAPSSNISSSNISSSNINDVNNATATSPQAGSKCVFLNEQGCMLARNNRPWHCLIYPLWTFRTQTELLHEEQCLICKNAKELHKTSSEQQAYALKALALTLEQQLELHLAMRRDWGLAED